MPHPDAPAPRTRMLLLAAAGTAALLLTGCAQTGAEPGPSTSLTAEATDPNMADEMFTAMMIPHHEQAIEMSDMLLAKQDADPEVADLAQRIKDAQGPEIELMEGWLSEWGSSMSDSGMSGMDHGGTDDGMMSDDDMTALEEADGATASRLFLEQMIEHHDGAIDMAQDVLEDGQSPEVRALAEQIIQTQQSEISEMQALLDQS
ncbi:DUF305 domain-containing protein [Microbacterium sp.]|uniref:DUF305 domain-containing protein n=1 Tax=Microbacterium sp. TaxID=51671 RepID=UPI0039E53175